MSGTSPEMRAMFGGKPGGGFSIYRAPAWLKRY
jgi:hypothetical protein